MRKHLWNVKKRVLGFVLGLLIILQFGPVPGLPQKTSTEQPAWITAVQVRAGHASVEIPEATKHQVEEAYGNLPLSFEANQGQTDAQVKFLSRGSGYTMFFTSTEMVLALRKSQGRENLKTVRSGDGKNQKLEHKIKNPLTVLRMKLLGANSGPRVSGLDQLQGKTYYFIGNNSTKWRTNIPSYAKVKYEAVYPGVDLIYYGNQHQLEYDFIVAPGADAKTITLAFEGVDKLEVDTKGDLLLHTAAGQITQHKPLVYQEMDGVRKEISGSYVLKDGH